MKIRSVLAAAVAACLTGCATAPPVYEVQNSRAVSEGKDVVWERIVEFFATNSLSIKTIEKDSGIIAAERMFMSPRMGGDVSGWASCGTGFLEVPVSQTVDLNVFVRATGPNTTSVTVNTRFSEARRFGNDPALTVSCNSNGVLESTVLDIASGR